MVRGRSSIALCWRNADGISSELTVHFRDLGMKTMVDGGLRRSEPKMCGMTMSVNRCRTIFSAVKIRWVMCHPTRDHLIEGVFVSPQLFLYDRQNGRFGHPLLSLRSRVPFVPKGRGGSGEIENLQLLCGACNSMKGSRSQEEFLLDLEALGLR